jgi:hypothetical protein
LHRTAIANATTGRSVSGAFGLKEICIGASFDLEGMKDFFAGAAFPACAGAEPAAAAGFPPLFAAAFIAAFLAFASAFFAAFF